MPGGAGFQPSTVGKLVWVCQLGFFVSHDFNQVFGYQTPPKITDKLPPSELAKIGWRMK